ncbi:MAG: HNH endonuclease [Pigmentiphaga sp.]
MGKLKTLQPRLPGVSPRIGHLPKDEAARSKHRDATQHWRSWYKTSRWQRLRWSILVRDLFTCHMCKGIEADTSRLVADHVRPHRGDEVLFWDTGNLQCLCKPCHDKLKQSEEQGSLHTRGVWY